MHLRTIGDRCARSWIGSKWCRSGSAETVDGIGCPARRPCPPRREGCPRSPTAAARTVELAAEVRLAGARGGRRIARADRRRVPGPPRSVRRGWEPSRGCSNWQACPTSVPGSWGRRSGWTRTCRSACSCRPDSPWVRSRRSTRRDGKTIRSRSRRRPKHSATRVFTKPATLGSSVGVSKVHDAAQLAAGLAEAFRYARVAHRRAGGRGRARDRVRGPRATTNPSRPSPGRSFPRDTTSTTTRPSTSTSTEPGS